jgi:hypothetical protein
MRKERAVRGASALELPHLKVVLRYLKVAEKGNVAPQRDIDLEVPHVAATLQKTLRKITIFFK